MTSALLAGSGFDLVMAALAAGSAALVAYLAVATRRLARLERAAEGAPETFSDTELRRIVTLARELLSRRDAAKLEDV